jgi:hypothetical protein
MSDISRIFSDARVNEGMLRAADKIGIAYSLTDDGRLNYRDEDATRLGDPGEQSLNDFFDSQWIALGIETETDLEMVVNQLKKSDLKFVVEWCNDQTYVILDRFDCPDCLSGRQL